MKLADESAGIASNPRSEIAFDVVESGTSGNVLIIRKGAFDVGDSGSCAGTIRVQLKALSNSTARDIVPSEESRAPSSVHGPSDSELTSFLDDVYLRDTPKLHRQAIDLAIGYVDRLLNDQQFEACRELLIRADPKRLSAPVLVSFLGITLAAKDVLADVRTQFIKKASSRLSQELGTERANRLLRKYT